jgi:transposase
LLFEQFSYSDIQSRFNAVRKLLNEHFKNIYPELINQYIQAEERLRNEILTVSEQFRSQLQKLLFKTENAEEDAFLQERIQKAAVYFREKNSLILQDLLDKTSIETDNKEIRKKINDALDLFQTEVRQKQQTLKICLVQFTVPAYLNAKSEAAIEDKNQKKKTGKDPSLKVLVSQDILHPELYEELRLWRLNLAQEQDVPAYIVLSQMALIGIANLLPQDSKQLLQIPGVGKVTSDRYGEEILQIVQQNVQQYGYEVKEFVIVQKSEQKTDTKEQSFTLYKQGKSLEEIAKERSLVVSTIEGHLLYYVKSGEIPLEKLVAPEKIDRINEVLQQNPEATLSEIKTLLGDDYSYGAIRFVRERGKAKVDL